MDIAIRKAEETDALAIAELLRLLELFPLIMDQSPKVVEDQVSWHLALCQSDNSHSVYVAQDRKGKILGYCVVHWLPYLMFAGPEGYVSELFLAQKARGLGIGGRLLKIVEAEAGKRGCSRLMLLNLRNRESYQWGFYNKQGWEERREAANFILDLEDKP